jgi:hypothetical protein
MDFIDFKAEILLKDVGNDPIKKAEAIRYCKIGFFVQNALKREVYLKEVSINSDFLSRVFSMSWMFRSRLPRIRLIMFSSSKRKKLLPRWRLSLWIRKRRSFPV